MKFVLVSLFLCCSMLIGHTQSSVTGKIIDLETGKGIAFVNIGIPAIAKGTVSSEDGSFELLFFRKEDVVTISSIGYATQQITIVKLLENGSVKLAPMVHDITAVEVVASKLGDNVTLGKKLDKRYRSISFSSEQLGTELASLIKIDKKTYIKSASFILNRVKKEGILFRVNIYDYKNKKVGENLLTENVLLSSPTEKGTITVDLSAFNLMVEEDILLSLELIKGDGNAIAFNAKKLMSGKYTHMKQTSNALFMQLNKIHLLVPKLQLGFFLEGQEISK